jgi:hypothetical protein
VYGDDSGEELVGEPPLNRDVATDDGRSDAMGDIVSVCGWPWLWWSSVLRRVGVPALNDDVEARTGDLFMVEPDADE